MSQPRGRLLWAWMVVVLPLAAGAAPPIAPPLLAEAPPPAEQGPPPALEDRPAIINSYQIERLDEPKVVRITLKLSYPKTTVDAGFGDSQASFSVIIPNTKPAGRLPAQIDVAEGAVADILLRPAGEADTQVLVRLNTPVDCTAFAKPSEKAVIIEVKLPEPKPETPDADQGPAQGAFGDRKLSVEFTDTDLKVILQTLMTESGANILLRPGIEGSYSLSLRDVTLTEALDALWEAWDLAWKPLPGNIILVGKLEDLGDDEVEAELRLPVGWTPSDLLGSLQAGFPELRLSRNLTDVPAEGPLPVTGPLRVVGQARQWTARLTARPGGAPPSPPALPERLEYYPRAAAAETLLAELQARYPGLNAQLDAELGRLVVVGPRDLLGRVRRDLLDLDGEPDPLIDKALWLPLVPAERITALAAASGLTIEVIHQEAGATLVYLRGLKSKIAVIEELATQLQSVREATPPAPEPQRVSRTYNLRSLSPAAAEHLAAQVGVAATSEGLTVTLEGPEPNVERALSALAGADLPPEQQVYTVRYARPEALARLIREAVPELSVVGTQYQRRPGDITQPVGAADGATRDQAQLGPTPADWSPAGPSPRLVLIGSRPAIDRALTLLAAVDAAPAQIELTAVLVELSDQAALDLGLDWRFGGEAVTFPFEPLVGGDISAVRRLVDSVEGARIIAGPTVRAVDGSPALLEIGERLHERDPAPGAVGVRLQLEPTAPGDGTILCRVAPTVSEWREGDDGRCRLITRRLETTVRLADGGVAAMGGLLSDDPADRQLVILLSARLARPVVGPAPAP